MGNMTDIRVIFGFLFCVTVCAVLADEKAHDSQPTVADDDSDMYMEPLEEDHQSSSSNLQPQTAESGQWFPSFQSSFDPFGHPPSGHSRPEFYNSNQQQEGAYSQRNEPPIQQDIIYNNGPKFNGFNGFAKPYQQETVKQPVSDKSASLLGDGNFGVIQGGTFYPEKNAYESDSSGYDDFSSFFHNGHGRPSYFYQPNPKPAGKKQQQFENFRDFAEINSPPERQYSQYVVVYTNKNGTRTSTIPNSQQAPEGALPQEPQPAIIDAKRPKNILESLTLLDQTETPLSETGKTMLLPSYDQGDIIDIPPEKKQSKSKRKLAKLLPEKKHEARLAQKAKDMMEPLLALS